MTTSFKIKTINIYAFRGITELELPLERKGLLLKGENGTGKSSIVDALEFFFTGSVSHLEGVQGISLEKYGPHSRFKPDQMKVQLSFDPGNIVLERTLDTFSKSPQHMDDYLGSLRQNNFILHRSQILEFIMSQPGDRFKALGNILGIESLDYSELAMLKAGDSLKAEITRREGDITSILASISGVLGTVDGYDNILPLLNDKIKELGQPPLVAFEQTEEYVKNTFREVILKASKSGLAASLTELELAIGSAQLPSDFASKVESFNQKIETLIGREVNSDMKLREFLDTGRTILVENQPDTCPFCEQKIAWEPLVDRIEVRTHVIKESTKEASEARALQSEIANALGILRNSLIKIQECFMQIPVLASVKDHLEELIAATVDMLTLAESGTDLRHSIPTKDALNLQRLLNSSLGIINQKRDIASQEIKLSDEQLKAERAMEIVHQVKAKADELNLKKSERDKFEYKYRIAEKLYQNFVDVKKRIVQDTYNSLQTEIQYLYDTLHAGDERLNLNLVVKAGKRASTNLEIDSLGLQRVDPRAIESEGHLDSLGLCVFLAFIKKFNQGCPLIVLDDVVSSIDAQHRESISNLLLKEFGDRQLIITTHDEVWYEQLRRHMEIEGINNSFKGLTIVGWSLAEGPRILPYKVRWDKIQDKLREGDKTGAGNEGRTYLEWILGEVCEKMHVPIELHLSGRYQVKDLLGPAEARVRRLTKGTEIESKVEEAFKEVEQTIKMANLMSHNNPEIEAVSLNEVKRFCKAVYNLHQSLICSQCGSFLEYYHGSNIIGCSNNSCRNRTSLKLQSTTFRTRE